MLRPLKINCRLVGLGLLVAIFIESCATTPTNRAYQAPLKELALCNMRVSNAPATNQRGNIKSFKSHVNLRGVSLALAPVDGCLSSGFGPRSGGAGSLHKGIDIFTKTPRAIGAAGNGIVDFVGEKRGYGKTVIIRHNKAVTTRYGHLSNFARGLKPGQRLRAGDVIGQTGETGNASAVHLHYEILVNGEQRNPLRIGN